MSTLDKNVFKGNSRRARKAISWFNKTVRGIVEWWNSRMVAIALIYKEGLSRLECESLTNRCERIVSEHPCLLHGIILVGSMYIRYCKRCVAQKLSGGGGSRVGWHAQPLHMHGWTLLRLDSLGGGG